MLIFTFYLGFGENIIIILLLTIINIDCLVILAHNIFLTQYENAKSVMMRTQMVLRQIKIEQLPEIYCKNAIYVKK